MRTAWLVVGLLAALAGAIWMLQGLNVAFVPRSFMTSDPAWVVIGGITLVAGIALATWSRRRS